MGVQLLGAFAAGAAFGATVVMLSLLVLLRIVVVDDGGSEWDPWSDWGER